MSMNARAALSEDVAPALTPPGPVTATTATAAADATPEPAAHESGPAPRRRRLETLRTIQYLMVFRVAMATLLLGTREHVPAE